MPSPTPLPPPPLPIPSTSPSLFRHVRLLLLSSPAPSANSPPLLHLHIDPVTFALSLPPPNTTSSLIPLYSHPPSSYHSTSLMFPLYLSATLTPLSSTLTLHLSLRNFHHALHPPTPLSNSSVLPSALSILLASGDTLHNRHMGLVRETRFGEWEIMENDGDGDGVWILGKGRVWEALNGLAEKWARGGKRKLTNQPHDAWLSGSVVVIEYDEGGAGGKVSKGWMRVKCGHDGRENWSYRLGDGTNDGWIKHQPSVPVTARKRRVSSGNRAGAAQSLQRALDRLDAEIGQRWPQTESDHSEDGRTSHGNTTDEDETMQVMCLKYLNNSYADEVKRQLDSSYSS